MTDDHRHEIALEAYRAAREARNLEVTLFWQRSNYFLVLSSALAVGFFTKAAGDYRTVLSLFGLVVSALWIGVNLGSKFWQSRWEHRLAETERALQPDLNLFSADEETVRSDVRQSLQFWSRTSPTSLYGRLVLWKPSVSKVMMILSASFSVLWLALFWASANRSVPLNNFSRPAWSISPEHSAAIQAVASVVSALTVVAALFVAYKALRSSQKQVDTAQEQVEATLRPVVVFQVIGNSVQIKNVGNGPAINLRWQDSEGRMQGRNVFRVEDTAPVTDHLTALVAASLEVPFTARYETLSGAKWIVIAHRDRDIMPEGFRLEIRREDG